MSLTNTKRVKSEKLQLYRQMLGKGEIKEMKLTLRKSYDDIHFQDR